MLQPDPNARQAQSVKQALVRCPTCREVTRLCRCWIYRPMPRRMAHRAFQGHCTMRRARS
jgi:hypothetical protein